VISVTDFKVTTFLKSNKVKTARLRDKVTIAQEETDLSDAVTRTMQGHFTES